MTIDKGTDATSSPWPAGSPAAAGSPIGFRLEPGSGVPTYLQLVHQVEQALRLGHLTEGDRLPTVKETVSSLAINPNTVLKAYRELEHRGLAEGKPGQGTFICGTLRRAGLAEQQELRTSLLGWLRSADEAGLTATGWPRCSRQRCGIFLTGATSGGAGARCRARLPGPVQPIALHLATHASRNLAGTDAGDRGPAPRRSAAGPGDRVGLSAFHLDPGVRPGSSLAAKAVLLAVALGIAAASVSWEFAWWSRMVTAVVYYHFAAPQFSYFPFSYAGWTVFGFSLAVLIGAITRRTVPALVGTLAGYGVLFYLRGLYRLPNNDLAAFSTRFPFRYSFDDSYYTVQLRAFAALILLSGLLVAAAGALIHRRSA